MQYMVYTSMLVQCLSLGCRNAITRLQYIDVREHSVR
jgi:hypothetical protein